MAIAIPAIAGPTSFIGIYADPYHYDMDAVLTDLYQQFTTWTWVLPSDDGIMCAEFSTSAPHTVITIGIFINPEHSVSLGDPTTGISICFPECRTDWTWMSQSTYLSLGIDYDWIIPGPHPDTGEMRVATCEPGYPIAPMYVYNWFGINQYAGG